jgi:hypothetical protein
MLCDRTVTLAFDAVLEGGIHDGDDARVLGAQQFSKKPVEEKSG